MPEPRKSKPPKAISKKTEAPATTPVGGRAAKAAQTRSDLLTAAQHLISTKGYEAASVDEIAREAGYTKGAFYTHFDSKQDLFLAVMNERTKASSQRLESVAPERNPLAPGNDFPEIQLLLSLEANLYALRHPELKEILGPLTERPLNTLALMAKAMRLGETAPEINTAPDRTDQITAVGIAATNLLGSILTNILPPDWDMKEVIAELNRRIIEGAQMTDS